MADDSASKRQRISSTSYADEGGDELEGGKQTKGTWGKDEDEKLIQAVNQFGTDNWKEVAYVVVGRSAKQCRDRYKLKLDPSINHGPWTKKEDDRLMELAKEHGRAWTKIAKFMPGRTENAVKSRISSLERSKIRDWTPEEDTLLKQLQQKMEFEKMTDYFPNRSVHSIRKRWELLHMDELTSKIRKNLKEPSEIITQPLISSGTSTPTHPYSLSPIPPQISQQHQLYNGSSISHLQPPPINAFPNSVMTIPSMSSLQTLPPIPVRSMPRGSDAASRLQRQSTSMTVLIQVLGDPNVQNSHMTSNPYLRSFSSGINNDSIPTSEGQTPKQQLLQALGVSFQNEKTEE